MNTSMIYFLLIAGAVFALTVVAERVLIPILRSHKVGQVILDIGPRWHKNKEGTPIMGGLGFILAAMLVMAAFFVVRAVQGESAQYIPLSITLAFAVGNGAIGFFDDYRKLVKHENEGLKWMQKLTLQLAIAAAYVFTLSYTGHISTDLNLPFTDATLSLGWTFYPIATLVLAGVVNGGNITDGVDGLASSVTVIIGIFVAVWSITIQDEQLSALAAIMMGASLGFLVYNMHPARVFMGDTGSLFLGALVIGAAFQSNEPCIGIIISSVFILEMLSSLLQVIYFKLTHGKRLFKMAPVHHHFEKCGWSEYRIVIVFSLVEALFCLLAWFAL